ncbi:hypothetical protein DJ564_25735 [Pseudomonas sp. 31-12]|nr:hypothetical protein DJ564_25735 [Pseudomonas sp. 31-12]
MTAILDIENKGEAAPSHTFRFEVLAAGVWGDAYIELEDGERREWGKDALFPRVGQPFTLKLSVNPDSPLIDRDFCLGLKSYSLVGELGLTVVPPLGDSRKLTPAGLTWECRGTSGGAFGFQLAASRLLKQSLIHPMSLGSTSPDSNLENATEEQVPG